MDYDDAGHFLEVGHNLDLDELQLKQPTGFLECDDGVVDLQVPPEQHLVWNYDEDNQQYIVETADPDGQDGCLDELVELPEDDGFVYEEVIEEEPPPEEIFEEITRARCIECDKIIDISQILNHRKHTCEMIKKHACEVCGTRFNFNSNLETHKILQHTQQADFVPGTECALCDSKTKKKFQRYSAYVAHVKTHVRTETFVCATCGEEFAYMNLYNRHRRVHHGIDGANRRGYSGELGYCNKCDKMLELSKVESHRLIHFVHQKIEKKEKIRAKVPATDASANKKKKHVCDQCGKAFVRPMELKRHSAIHDKDAKLKCLVCDKLFSHQSGLSAHIKHAHSAQKTKITCTICNAIFTKRSNLERHVKTVHPISTEKQLLECCHCSCLFKSLGALNKHLRIAHNAEKQTQLPCGKEFRLMSTLKSHQLDQDGNPTYPHRCFKCFKRFKLRSSLKIHLDVHQRKEIDDPVLTDPKCPICLKHLSSKNNLKRHLLTHQNQYECPDCYQKFGSVHRLDRHRCFKAASTSFSMQYMTMGMPMETRPPIVPTKSYSCKKCNASFYSFRAFKDHKSLHSGHRPHLCWTCHKSFRTAELLALHKDFHNRDPISCEYCSTILFGRVQYGAHVRAMHQHMMTEPSAIVQAQREREIEVSSSQAFPIDDASRCGFRVRAQSAVPEGREDLGWNRTVTTETVTDRSLRCPVCLHVFDSVAHLTQHFANTQDERDHSFCVFPCPLCERSLRGSGDAASHFTVTHIYIDEPNRPPAFAEEESDYNDQTKKAHACGVCPFSFNKKSDLERHIRTHTGERPFQCEVCTRAFSLRSSLNTHMKIHSRGEPEHQCSVCETDFFTKNALVLHMRIHSGEKPLRCRFCTASFRSSSTRQRHESAMHQVAAGECKGSCTRGCAHCATRKKTGVTVVDGQANTEFTAPPVVSQPVDSLNLPAVVVDQGVAFKKPPATRKSIFRKPAPPSPKNPTDLIMETLAQITKVEALPLETSESSAFDKTPAHSAESRIFIHITARRILMNEYSVTISKKAPRAIREGIDSTSSIPLATLQGLSQTGTPMRLSLMDNQQLNVLPKGILNALGMQSSVVLRAYPSNPAIRSCVELIPLNVSEFCSRCEICEVDLPTKEISDAHFASEDHETAQVLHPLAEAVQETVNDCLMTATTVPRHRREEVTCKLCGRKFLDTEPLVAHIRLEHERDHPHSLAPRPIARTAPPLEVIRDSF